MTSSYIQFINTQIEFNSAIDFGGGIYIDNNDQNLNENSKKKIMDHIEIIFNDTLTIFKKNNIVPVVSINEKLDPNKHQAMMEIEDDSKEPGTIVQEIQKGFMLKDRLLRPSLVGVSKKPKKTEEKEPKK